MTYLKTFKVTGWTVDGRKQWDLVAAPTALRAKEYFLDRSLQQFTETVAIVYANDGGEIAYEWREEMMSKLR